MNRKETNGVGYNLNLPQISKSKRNIMMIPNSTFITKS